MLEVKWADNKMSNNFSIFDRYFKEVIKIQLVKDIDREKTYPGGTEIRRAHTWLAELSFV